LNPHGVNPHRLSRLIPSVDRFTIGFLSVNLTLSSSNYTHLVSACSTSTSAQSCMYSSGSATYLKSIALITDNPVSPGSMFVDSVKIYKLGEAVFTVVAPKFTTDPYYQ